MVFKDKLFSNTTNMSNVVLLETDSGTSSAIFVGNGNSYLLTAAHVVDDMVIGDYCDIEFQDPNDSYNVVYARAELLYRGDWKANMFTVENCKEDYALMNITLIDPLYLSLVRLSII